VAESVLTNLLLVQFGGEAADDTAMIELLAGAGLPIADLPNGDRTQLARLMDALRGAVSMDELVAIAEDASLQELRGVIPVATLLLEVVPGELRALIPRSVAELLPVLLAPLVVQLGRVADGLFADSHAPDFPEAASLSQAPATMEPMPPPRPPGQPGSEVRSE
jgi:hypothetical protein